MLARISAAMITAVLVGAGGVSAADANTHPPSSASVVASHAAQVTESRSGTTPTQLSAKKRVETRKAKKAAARKAKKAALRKAKKVAARKAKKAARKAAQSQPQPLPPTGQQSQPPTDAPPLPQLPPNAPPLPQPSPESQPVSGQTVTSFGAVGDGATDNCSSLQHALDATTAGQTLIVPAGQVFNHSCVLRITQPGIRLTGGGTLHATNETRASLLVDAASVTIDNLLLTMVSTTQRWEEYEQMRLRLGSVADLVIHDIKIDGAGAAGIYVGGAFDFTITRVEVINTRADGIHITEGAHDGAVTDATIRNSGDDGVAVVSYGTSTRPCRNIAVVRPSLYGQTWGRAFSVVGGDQITFRDIYAQNSSAASVYIASEGGSYNTWPSTNVTVDGGTIVNANQTPSVDHGAVLLYNGRNAVNSNITVKNLRVRDTRADASRQIGIIQDSGGTHARVTLANIAMTGPAGAFGGNAPQSSYNRTNITSNGQQLGDRLGWS